MTKRLATDRMSALHCMPIIWFTTTAFMRGPPSEPGL
jgi:hypothetical protein